MFQSEDGQVNHRGPQPLSVAAMPTGGSLVSQFKAHWDQARGADPLPDRHALDPAALDAALPFSFVAERVAPEILRLRVAGNRIGSLLGMEPRGIPLCTFFTTPGREALGPIIARVLDEPAMAEMRLTMARGVTRPPIEATMVLMPLQGVHGISDRVIGAIFSDFLTAPSGARFDIDRRSVRIESVAAEKPELGALRVVAGGRAFRGRASGRSGLRLVVDNS